MQNGQTSLKIAQKLGYISVLDSLKPVTEAVTTPDQPPPSEEKYRVVAPEAMHETFMSDSEEEGGRANSADTVFLSILTQRCFFQAKTPCCPTSRTAI